MADCNDSPQTPIPSELVREDPSFADIVIEFVDGLEDRVRAMEEAINQSDFEALRTAAHQLKGSGGGYGYPDLSTTSAELEQYAKAEGLEGCQNVLNDLKSLCGRVVVGDGE